MVKFNELQFSDDLKTLTIDCELEDTGTDEENEGFFISAVYLEYYKNRNVTGAPSDKKYTAYSYTSGTRLTSIELEIESSDLDYDTMGVAKFDEGLFYVIVSCKKYLTDPEDEEEIEVVNEFGAVLDWNCVYNIGMKAIAAYENSRDRSCNVPADLEQFAITWHSLDLAIEAQDLDMLDMLWSRFVGSPFASKDCNCS